MAFLSFYLMWFMFGGRDLHELRHQSSGAVSDQETWLGGLNGGCGWLWSYPLDLILCLLYIPCFYNE